MLIICPKGAIPQWRRTIARSPDAGKSVTLINFERTKSLMAPPAASTRRSTRAKNNELARHGAPKRIWPLVVIDEATASATRTRSRAWSAGRWRRPPTSRST